MEKVITMLYPYAVIKYDGIYSSFLDSSIGLEKVSISPRMFRDEIQLERIIFHAPSLGFLKDAQEELEDGNIPERMGITLDGLTLDMTGQFAKRMNKDRTPPALGSRSNAYGCHKTRKFKPEQLADMGYDVFSSDLKMNYQFYPHKDEFYVSAQFRNRQMFEVDLESYFKIKKGKFKVDNIDRLFRKCPARRLIIPTWDLTSVQ